MKKELTKKEKELQKRIKANEEDKVFDQIKADKLINKKIYQGLEGTYTILGRFFHFFYMEREEDGFGKMEKVKYVLEEFDQQAKLEEIKADGGLSKIFKEKGYCEWIRSTDDNIEIAVNGTVGNIIFDNGCIVETRNIVCDFNDIDNFIEIGVSSTSRGHHTFEKDKKKKCGYHIIDGNHGEIDLDKRKWFDPKDAVKIVMQKWTRAFNKVIKIQNEMVCYHENTLSKDEKDLTFSFTFWDQKEKPVKDKYDSYDFDMSTVYAYQVVGTFKEIDRTYKDDIFIKTTFNIYRGKVKTKMTATKSGLAQSGRDSYGKKFTLSKNATKVPYSEILNRIKTLMEVEVTKIFELKINYDEV